jgi:hypothetical protein
LVLGAIAFPAFASWKSNLTVWEAVDAGPVKGVGWWNLEDRSVLPAEAGGTNGWGIDFTNPNDFVFRMPDAESKPEVFLVAGGHEIPLRKNATFGDKRLHSVQPIRQYPPDLESMELVVKSPGLKPSRFKIHHLPPTRYRFPVDGPERTSQTVEGVRFEGAAWTEAPVEGCLPYIAGALRLTGTPPGGGKWEWRSPKLAVPFESTDEIRLDGSSYTRIPVEDSPSFGIVNTHLWAGLMPKVQLSGRIARFEEVRDTIDFGELEVYRHMPNFKVDYALRLDKPIVAKSAGGFRVRLEPIVNSNSGHGDMFASQISVRLFVEPESAQVGFSEAMRAAKGESEVLVGWPGQDSLIPVPGMRPVREGNPTNFLQYKGLKEGDRIRLKLQFVRRVAVQEIPFSLTPKVAKLTSPVESTRRMRENREDTSSSFTPKPEDFKLR